MQILKPASAWILACSCALAWLAGSTASWGAAARPVKFITVTINNALIWIGDRWGSRPDGVKGHDFQFWSPPLHFDRAGNIAPIANVPTWTLTIREGTKEHSARREPYLWPKEKDPHPLKIDPCAHRPLSPEVLRSGNSREKPGEQP